MVRRTTAPPAPDPFEPQPRHEEIRCARFWPDTLFVDLSAYPDEFQTYDQDDLRFWEQGDLGILVAAAARTHEQMHWLQLAGTTYGRFLAANRLTTGDLAEAILRTATPAELGRLRDARDKGTAPAARDRQGRLRHPHGYSATLQALFDHWWASVALDSYLTDGGALLGQIYPSFAVGLGLRYATAAIPRDVFNSPDQRFFEDTIAFGPTDGRAPPIASGLTVRHIEETAAMVEQHLCNAGFAAELPPERRHDYAARSAAWTLDRFIDDRQSLYTRAFAHLSDRAPAMPAQRFLELVLLACDLALNPVIPDDGSPLGSTWGDFHPVCRFERIAAALATFTPDLAEAGGEAPTRWWAEERDRLARHAGVADGAASEAFLDMGDPAADPLSDPTGHLRGFLGRAGRNLRSLRDRFPAAVASPVHALRADADAFTAALAGQAGPGFDPPLNIKSLGDGEPALSVTEGEYVRALVAVTERRTAHSWLVRTGPLNFAGLPEDGAARMIQDHAARRLDKAVG